MAASSRTPSACTELQFNWPSRSVNVFQRTDAHKVLTVYSSRAFSNLRKFVSSMSSARVSPSIPGEIEEQDPSDAPRVVSSPLSSASPTKDQKALVAPPASFQPGSEVQAPMISAPRQATMRSIVPLVLRKEVRHGKVGGYAGLVDHLGQRRYTVQAESKAGMQNTILRKAGVEAREDEMQEVAEMWNGAVLSAVTKTKKALKSSVPDVAWRHGGHDFKSKIGDIALNMLRQGRLPDAIQRYADFCNERQMERGGGDKVKQTASLVQVMDEGKQWLDQDTVKRKELDAMCTGWYLTWNQIQNAVKDDADQKQVVLSLVSLSCRMLYSVNSML